MYTECPECRSAFRLTVTVLRQAHGRVRCGSCGHVFDALDYLQDDAGNSHAGGIEETSAGIRFERQSRALLKSLDELTGPGEVRIEDTGIEWRVIDLDDDEDQDAAAGSADDEADDVADDTGALHWYIDEPSGDAADADEDAPQAPEPAQAGPADAALSLEEDTLNRPLDDDAAPEPADGSGDDAGTPPIDTEAQVVLDLGDDADEMRYDDNTPLPDDEAAPAPTPRRRAEDLLPPPIDNELQEDLGLGDPDDWRALLDEVDDGSARGLRAERRSAAPPDGLSLAVADDGPPPDDDAAPHGASAPAARNASETVAVTDDTAVSGVSGGQANAAQDGTDDSEPSSHPQTTEELLQAFSRQDAGATTEEVDRRLVETIVMEGETIRSALDDDGFDDDELPAPVTRYEINIPPPVEEHEPAPPRPYWHGLAVAAALGLLLSAQLVHANRESLARIGAVHATLGPIYRLFGDPLIPAWNIRGWQFESTTGSTNADGTRLTIYSRIANRADDALPYPLVHLSLTDRFEDVVGSRVLAPDEYLAGNGDTARTVPAGDAFTAVIAIDAPADDATGFKLNVCYRIAAERLRCAIDDFKN